MPLQNGLPASTEELVALIEQLRAAIVAKDEKILALTQKVSQLTLASLDALPEIDPYEN